MDDSCDWQDGCFVKTGREEGAALVRVSLVAKPSVCFCRRAVSWALLPRLRCKTALPRVDKRGHLSRAELTPSRAEDRSAARVPVAFIYLLFIPGSRRGPAHPALLRPVSSGAFFLPPLLDMKSAGLPAWGRGLRGCGFSERSSVLTLGCMALGCGGGGLHMFSRHKPWDSGASWPLLSAPLPSPPSISSSSSHVSAQECRLDFFLQEMKRSSVQEGSEGLAPPRFPSLNGKERESDKLSPSFWSVGG